MSDNTHCTSQEILLKLNVPICGKEKLNILDRGGTLYFTLVIIYWDFLQEIHVLGFHFF